MRGGEPRASGSPPTTTMRVHALGILEPPGFDRRVMPGEKADVPAQYGARVCADGLARPVGRKPSDRAETRPKANVEAR